VVLPATFLQEKQILGRPDLLVPIYPELCRGIRQSESGLLSPPEADAPMAQMTPNLSCHSEP